MELLFPNPMSTTVKLNIKVTDKFLQLGFSKLLFSFLLTLSSFTHVQEYKIQRRNPCPLPVLLELSYSQLTFRVFVPVSDGNSVLSPLGSWPLSGPSHHKYT